MERLGQLIQRDVEGKFWKPIILGKDGQPISHIFFTDDLFLFLEVEVDQAHKIKEALLTFDKSSKHSVNEQKTTI